MSSTSTLLVYGAGPNQVPVLAAARRRGWRIVAVDRDPEAPGAPLADRFVCTSLRDHDAIVAAIDDEPLRGVVARVTDPIALDSSRRIAEVHGLAAPCADLVAAATSKRALGELCRASAIRTPARRSPEEAIGILSKAGCERPAWLCVRPDVTIRGKLAIRRIGTPWDFDDAVREAAAASANGEVDVSEWIEGIDASVLAELDRGRARRLALWDEWVALAPSGHIVGIGAGMPSIAADDVRGIDDCLAALARACPGSRCLVTVSLRIDGAGRAGLIEVHLGVGGDAIADRLFPAALPGFDVFGALIALQAGLPLDAPSRSPRARGLLRAGEDWQLIEAETGEALRERVRRALPPDLEPPTSLVERRGR